jgi:ubiquinone/menaquinone biosynthesis C-methylase UbiE
MRVPWDEPGVAAQIDAYWVEKEGPWRILMGVDMKSQLGKHRQVLEVGCGSGLIYEEMRKRGIIDAIEYYGIDISQQMVELAKARFPDAEFVTTKPLPLPMGNEVVVCIQVLQHLADYKPLLQELAQVTGQVLYIVTWLASEEQLRFDGRFHENVYSIGEFIGSVVAARGGIRELRLRHLWQQCYSITVRYA